ncbi:ferroptosis suppressor protein 1 [Ailuropoda melanoleuca]|uniref:ferroptosis suppressor protein 1 n=1 Tax=Ailuropoda melanoleuca TaxID=9646 RepID=UPI0014942D76|nr:ferroptosis suppressor protein 1 [Ailuropoda melanoleuca]
MGSQVSVDVGAVRVVIVGGGFGGIAAASQLQALNIPFLLVDMKDSFHHNVAALRASVESGFAKKTFISYTVTFKENFRQGLVVDIDLQNQTVLLEDGEALPFSHLILATGSTGLFPGKFNEVSSREAAIQAYEDMVKQVQRSQSVVVVGGGSAGVEMAAEVKTEFPEKEVGTQPCLWTLRARALGAVCEDHGGLTWGLGGGAPRTRVSQGPVSAVGCPCVEYRRASGLFLPSAQSVVRLESLPAWLGWCGRQSGRVVGVFLGELFPELLGKFSFIFPHCFWELSCLWTLQGGGIATLCILGQQGRLAEGRGGRQELKARLVGSQPGCRARPCQPRAHGSRLTGERVSNLEDLRLNEYGECIRVHTDKGTEVATNLVIVCNGIRVNSSAYHSAFDSHLASNGALRVNEYLQVEGCSHVYAIGDCADVKEPKMAYHAGLHASVAVTNIVNSMKQRPLKAYKPGALTFLLAMGRNDGVGQISGFYVGRLMVRLAKSRDLFVSSSWKTMRQSPP